MLLCAAAASAAADVITTHDGERIEGVIIEADDQSVLVRWGAGRATISRRLHRREIASLRLTPPDVASLRDLARRSELQGDLRDAALVWHIVCALQPESADDQLRRAQALRLSGSFDDAAAAADAAARLAPEDARVPLEQGEVRLALGDARRAAQHALDHLKRAGPGSLPGQWLIARAFERAEMGDDAVAAYRKVLAADPAHVGALQRLVDLLLSRQATLEAESVARSFVQAAPDVRAGRLALGTALYRQSRFGEAVDALRAATSLGGPDYDRARIYLHCARARSAGTDPIRGLADAELAVARDLDPDLRRDQP